jgi:ankyrin
MYTQDDFGKTPLHIWKFCNLQFIENKINLNIQDNLGASPLFYAIENKHFNVCKLLIENGANVNLTNKFKKTPLHIASHFGQLEICKILISNLNINEEDVFGFTPLHNAIRQSKKDVAKFLIENGANVNAATHLGNTALHLVVEHGNIEMCKFLLNIKNININIQNMLGKTPLMISKNTEISLLLFNFKPFDDDDSSLQKFFKSFFF